MGSEQLTDEEAKRLRAATGVVVVAAIVSFIRGVPGDLIRSWGDGPWIVRNEAVHQVSWEGFASFFGGPLYGSYRPLHFLSYWLDVPWFGARGPSMHAVSLALWCLALVFFLRALRAWGLTLVAATIGTLVVGLHPIQVEAVTWASGRSAVLAVLFASLALLFHAKTTNVRSKSAWGSRLCVLLAVLCDPNALALPLVLLFGDVYLRGFDWKTALLAQLPVAGVIVACAYVMFRIGPAADAAAESGPLVTRVAATTTHALETLFWPAHVSPVYRTGHLETLGARVWTGPLILMAALAFAWARKNKAFSFVALSFIALLLPVMNLWLVPFLWLDRYLVLPLLALGFGVALLVNAFPRTNTKSEWPRVPVLAAASVVLVALGVRTSLYTAVWRNDGTLWRYAVDAQPNAFHAWYNLGIFRRDRGDFAGALDAFTRATELEPRQRLGFSGLMSALAMRDEVRHGLPRSQALRLAQLYAEQLDNIDSLHDLAERMLETGYQDAAYLPLSQWMDAHPVDDDRLERAAQVRVRLHDAPLARFYVSRMHRAPVPPELQALRVRQIPR